MYSTEIVFTLQLALLYVAHIALSICASIAILIIILLFRRFEVFHSNLRTLLLHFHLCILLNLCMQMLRIMIPIMQPFWLQDDNIDKNELKNCTQYNAFPAPFCAFLCVAGVLICMERLYATFNFAKYENECFEPFLTRFFVIIWTILLLYSFWEMLVELLPNISNNSYFACLLQQIRINPLKTHWHILFALLFHGVYCLVHYVILTVNREKQEVYVKFYYSSLSHRFQISENLKTVRMLLWTFPLFCITFLSILGHSAWLYYRNLDGNNENGENLLLLAELSLLFVPTLSLFVALTILRSSPMYISKAKLIAKELLDKFYSISGQFGGGSARRMMEL